MVTRFCIVPGCEHDSYLPSLVPLLVCSHEHETAARDLGLIVQRKTGETDAELSLRSKLARVLIDYETDAGGLNALAVSYPDGPAAVFPIHFPNEVKIIDGEPWIVATMIDRLPE